MCLISFHINDHPTYKFIVAANRDEFFGRPTAEASFWDDNPSILAGRDLMQMGTWLGLTKTGKFAALTNYRKLDDHDQTKTSRGKIITNYLTENIEPKQYLHSLKKENEKYNGFNVILGTVDDLYYYGNYQSDIIKLTKGTHALSNHLLNTPWPKVTQLKSLLKKYVTQQNQIDPNDMFQILNISDLAEDQDLPNTGVGLELERQLSPIFIKTENYGTRSSTVILVTHNNDVQFFERTYNSGQSHKQVQFSFQIKE